jgi:hypothetical protein
VQALKGLVRRLVLRAAARMASWYGYRLMEVEATAGAAANVLALNGYICRSGHINNNTNGGKRCAVQLRERVALVAEGLARAGTVSW